MTALVATVAVGLATSAAAETVSMASEARLWLAVPDDQPPPREVRISRGNIRKADWERNPARRERKMDVTFPIHWWSWSDVEIHLQPEHDGPLTLTLTGPWRDDGKGACQRQEVLWRGITAEGSTIQNGGFELRGGPAPDSWSSPWAPYPVSVHWPLTPKISPGGSPFAASWHNRPLQQVLQVKKGVPVTLRLGACAATPPDFVEPARLGNDTPAHRAAATLKRGVNFGNGWEANSTWGHKFTVADVDQVADEGFDHIRIPVAFHRHLVQTAAGLTLSPALLAELEPVLRHAINRKLTVLLDWHHFDEFTTDPVSHLDRFVTGWECIARHFHDWPPGLFYELLNEPHDKLDTPELGPVYQKTIAAIRSIDPNRIIVISPGRWGAAGELDQLRLPDKDDRLIVTIHCYEPFHFTHQGAGWVGLSQLGGVVYPGPPSTPLAIPAALKGNASVVSFVDAYNRQPASSNPSSAVGIRQTLELAAKWSKHFGRPVHLGEFGAFHVADDGSRSRYLRDVRALAGEFGIPWTLWEWKSGFGYWDPKTGRARFRKELID